jgi:hypothetical protein
MTSSRTIGIVAEYPAKGSGRIPVVSADDQPIQALSGSETVDALFLSQGNPPASVSRANTSGLF